MAASRWPIAVVLAGLALLTPSASRADFIAPPSAEEAARIVALDNLPLERRGEVGNLIKAEPIHVLIKTSPFLTTHQVYEYLLDHLPLATTLGRVLKLSPYVVERIGPATYRSSDQNGLEGVLSELVADDGNRVYFGRGRYDGFFLRGVTGQAVIVLNYREVQLADGSTAMANTVHFLVLFDDPVLQGVARLIGSLLQGLVEGKITAAVSSAQRLTELLASDPKKVFTAMSDGDSFTQAERVEFARLFLKP